MSGEVEPAVQTIRVVVENVATAGFWIGFGIAVCGFFIGCGLESVGKDAVKAWWNREER